MPNRCGFRLKIGVFFGLKPMFLGPNTQNHESPENRPLTTSRPEPLWKGGAIGALQFEDPAMQGSRNLIFLSVH